MLLPSWARTLTTTALTAVLTLCSAQTAHAQTPRHTPLHATTRTAPSTARTSSTAVLRPGAHGASVRILQQRLAAHGYWLGTANGIYGSSTEQAVMAFQKAEGLGRDGTAGPVTLRRLVTAHRPTPRTTGRGHIVEIDLNRQLVLIVDNGVTTEAYNTSTGSDGRTGERGTPPGRYTVSREVNGIRHARLGDLYRPKYFNGGIALHGSPSIPATPQSHGCARLSNAAMDHLWRTGAIDIHRHVWVY